MPSPTQSGSSWGIRQFVRHDAEGGDHSRASVFERMRDIVLPLARQSLLIATLASFGTSVFDLALASMLKPANYSLMPLVIDRAFEFSRYGYATATVVSAEQLY